MSSYFCISLLTYLLTFKCWSFIQNTQVIHFIHKIFHLKSCLSFFKGINGINNHWSKIMKPFHTMDWLELKSHTVDFQNTIQKNGRITNASWNSQTILHASFNSIQLFCFIWQTYYTSALMLNWIQETMYCACVIIILWNLFSDFKK